MSCWLGTAALASAAPVTIFEDTFDLDPASNGWTETAVGNNPANPAPFIRPTVPGTVAFDDDSDGTAYFNARAQGATLSIDRVISTSGYTNITVELIAFQRDNGTFEAADFISISAGGSTVFQSNAVFMSDPVTNGLGNSTPTSSGVIVLPASAADQATLAINVTTSTSAGSEDYFVSNFRVTGELIAAVPEASSAFLFGICGFGFLLRQSRCRRSLRLI